MKKIINKLIIIFMVIIIFGNVNTIYNINKVKAALSTNIVFKSTSGYFYIQIDGDGKQTKRKIAVTLKNNKAYDISNF